MPGVQVQACTIEQARLAVTNLAALHAGRWNDESVFDLPFVARPTTAGAEFLGTVVAAATEVFVDRFAEQLDEADVVTLRAAAAAMTHWQMARPSPFAVMHGDYRLDNLLFDPAGARRGRRRLADAVGRPSHARPRILPRHEPRPSTIDERPSVTSSTTTTRRCARRGVTGYAAGQCFDDYRLGQLQGPMVTTIGCAYATGRRSADADEMFLAMARRSCAAIRDLDSLAAIGIDDGSAG